MKFYNTKASKGFTLIELLVVIAIIGLLAAVVLASLGSARQKGSDAAIKSDLNSARPQGEIVASNNGGKYDNVCTDATILKQVSNAITASGSTIALDTTVADGNSATHPSICHSTAAGWAIAIPLASNSAQYWCVDSTGIASSTATGVAASAYKCS